MDSIKLHPYPTIPPATDYCYGPTLKFYGYGPGFNGRDRHRTHPEPRKALYNNDGWPYYL